VKHFIGILIGAITISTSTFAHSTDYAFTKEYDACIEKSGGITSEMLNCNESEFARQDKALNANYKLALKVVSAERGKKILAAQRAWIKFRDANCDSYYDIDGGTASTLNASSCRLNTTAMRASELKLISDN